MENFDIANITTYQSGVMQSAAHRILGRINADYLSQFDLTPMQWFVIGYLYDANDTGIQLSDLMRTLDTTMPFVTSLVNMLEHKGIAYKTSSISDSRVKIVILNADYRSTVEEIENGLRDELRNRLYAQSNISRDELNHYVSVLYKIMSTK